MDAIYTSSSLKKSHQQKQLNSVNSILKIQEYRVHYHYHLLFLKTLGAFSGKI